MRIARRLPGELLSPTQMDQLIAVCNAILNLEVREGKSPGFTITNENAVLTVGASSANGTSLEIRVDGVLVPNQSVLNLISGDGVTITADENGITFTAVGGSAPIWL